MEHPSIGDRVTLKHDIPELELHRGECGIVQSTWFVPLPMYEVEFDTQRVTSGTRALVREEQVECVPGEARYQPLTGL